jgi:CBS domain-containing protein
MLVSQILKSKSDDGIVTVAPEASVSDAAKLLAARRIGAVVVSSDGKTAKGILSERDIVRELGKAGAGCLSASVGSIMTAEIVGCSLSDTSDGVLAAMTKGPVPPHAGGGGRRDGRPDLHRRRGQGAAIGTGDGEDGAGGHDQGFLSAPLDDAGRTRFRNRVAEGLRNGFASALGGGCNAGVGMIVCAPQDISDRN